MNGTILRNHYKILSELGRGGFGTTYLALDLDLPDSPKCVVKQLSPSDPRPEVFQVAKELFSKEARMLQRLGEHPQIPRLFAYFEESGQFYLVQEFVEGEDLRREICPGKSWSEGQVIQLLTEILEALKSVHQENVIHRDLKPQNIMRRTSDGKIVLIDFGAVKEIKGLTVTSAGHTTTTIAVGTPGYMPSEQAAGKPRFCSDIYAVGMMGIEALTGMSASQFPLDPSTDEIIWKNQVHVSEKLGNILDKMVFDYWRHRYQTIDEVMDKLKTVGNHSVPQTTIQATVYLPNNPPTQQSQPPQPSSPPQPVKKTQSNKPWHKVILFGSITSVILGLIFRGLIYRIFFDVYAWTTQSRIEIEAHSFTGHSAPICNDSCIAISPDGQTIISGSNDRTIKVWDLATGDLLKTLRTGDSQVILSLAISHDGQTIISGGHDGDYNGIIKVWDLATGNLLKTLRPDGRSIESVAISPDGQTIASGGAWYDGTIKIWDSATGTLLNTLNSGVPKVPSVAISPDGRTLVSSHHDRTIRVWNLATGNLLKTLTIRQGLVDSVAISPDGKTIVGGGSNIMVWDLETGTLLKTLTIRQGWVNSVAISPDGKTIVGGGSWDNNTIKIWDLSSGRLQTLPDQSSQVRSVAISPDGQKIISGHNGTIKVWDLGK